MLQVLSRVLSTATCVTPNQNAHCLGKDGKDPASIQGPPIPPNKHYFDQGAWVNIHPKKKNTNNNHNNNLQNN